MSDFYNAFVGLGLTSSAFLVFSQIGAAHFGVLPMILNEDSRRQAGLTIQQSVRIWDYFFTRATLPVAVSIMTQSISYAIASTYLKSSTNQSLLRIAAATGFFPLPYTLSFILPSIKVLQNFSQRESGQSLSESEEKIALAKLKEWNNRHYIRMGIYLVSFLTALLAIVPNRFV